MANGEWKPSNPRPDTLTKVAEVIGITPDELLGEEWPPNRRAVIAMAQPGALDLDVLDEETRAHIVRQHGLLAQLTAAKMRLAEREAEVAVLRSQVAVLAEHQPDDVRRLLFRAAAPMGEYEVKGVDPDVEDRGDSEDGTG